MKFSNTLKDLREIKQVTQGQLAEYLKVSRPTVAGYETKNHQPDFEKLEKMARYFDVSIDYLVTGSDSGAKKITTPLINEKALDNEFLITYRSLSVESKQDALKYVKLLQLKDKQTKQDC